MSNSAKSVRQLTQLNYAQKKEICSYKKENPTVKQTELIEIFSKKFSLKIPRSTMSNIILNSNQILVSDSPGFRERKAKYPEMEHALYLWFCQIRDMHLSISDAMLKAQAEIFGSPEYFSIHSFFYSEGWISQFK